MLQTSARGFGRGSRQVVAATISILLASTAAQAEDRQPATDAELEPVIVVIGKRSNLDTIPGSGMVLDQSVLEESHVFSVNEALRKVPGVFARDEEGFGLRPNLGIRGLNPTRSAKLLMLEDGIPLAYAPYGDNASYYHPPVNRFERIEVLKGSSQIMFGPQTLGGLVNYITPGVPAGLEGSLGATRRQRGLPRVPRPGRRHDRPNGLPARWHLEGIGRHAREHALRGRRRVPESRAAAD